MCNPAFFLRLWPSKVTDKAECIDINQKGASKGLILMGAINCKRIVSFL